MGRLVTCGTDAFMMAGVASSFLRLDTPHNKTDTRSVLLLLLFMRTGVGKVCQQKSVK